MNHQNALCIDSDDESLDNGTIALNFDIKRKTVYNIGRNKTLIKITLRELIQYVGNWTYNRDIDADKVNELKEQYISKNCNDYFNIMDNDNDADISPAWIISIVYDKEATGAHKLFVIDGQHRREVIRQLLEEGKMQDTIEILCIMYSIDNCYKENKKMTLELFKKINNNLQLKDTDFPKILALQLVEAIAKDKELVSDSRKIIRNDGNNQGGVAYEPLIHERELFALFNTNYPLIENLSCEEIIANLKIIKQRICFKDFENIYTNTQQNIKRYAKARKYDFWLNLKSSARCKPSEWIKYIATPNDFRP
jgi:hypothetical protein